MLVFVLMIACILMCSGSGFITHTRMMPNDSLADAFQRPPLPTQHSCCLRQLALAPPSAAAMAPKQPPATQQKDASAKKARKFTGQTLHVAAFNQQPASTAAGGAPPASSSQASDI